MPYERQFALLQRLREAGFRSCSLLDAMTASGVGMNMAVRTRAFFVVSNVLMEMRQADMIAKPMMIMWAVRNVRLMIMSSILAQMGKGMAMDAGNQLYCRQKYQQQHARELFQPPRGEERWVHYHRIEPEIHFQASYPALFWESRGAVRVSCAGAIELERPGRMSRPFRVCTSQLPT